MLDSRGLDDWHIRALLELSLIPFVDDGIRLTGKKQTLIAIVRHFVSLVATIAAGCSP